MVKINFEQLLILWNEDSNASLAREYLPNYQKGEKGMLCTFRMSFTAPRSHGTHGAYIFRGPRKTKIVKRPVLKMSCWAKRNISVLISYASYDSSQSKEWQWIEVPFILSLPRQSLSGHLPRCRSCIENLTKWCWRPKHIAKATRSPSRTSVAKARRCRSPSSSNLIQIASLLIMSNWTTSIVLNNYE